MIGWTSTGFLTQDKACPIMSHVQEKSGNFESVLSTARFFTRFESSFALALSLVLFPIPAPLSVRRFLLFPTHHIPLGLTGTYRLFCAT